MCSVLSDCDIKKEPESSGVSDCEISTKVKCEDMETDVRKKDESPATDHIKIERNFVDTIDIKYEDFEYDFHSHSLGEDITIHPNNVFSHTSTQDMVENISREVCDVKNLNTNLVGVKKKTISGEKRITCNICHKSFTQSYNLNRHMKNVHRQEKTFSCDICHSSFSQKSNLSHHLRRVHEGEKPFSCDICPRSFFQKSKLSQHVKSVHEGEKPFSCDICHHSFSQKSNLSQHVKAVNEREKPFSCDICHESFIHKSKLSQHVKSVHEAAKPFSCDVCPSSFSTKGNLSQHVKAVHKRKRACSLVRYVIIHFLEKSGLSRTCEGSPRGREVIFL